MPALRRLVLTHRVAAGIILALVLAMKLLMPGGFMPVVSDGRIVVSVCSGTGPTMMVIAIPGLQHGDADGGSDHRQDQAPCAFAGLSAPAAAAADPALLAAAIVFVIAARVRIAARPAAAAPPYLRPPLRGPPAAA